MASQAPRKKTLDLEEGNSEGLELLRQSLNHIDPELRHSEGESTKAAHIFVVFGASGDLAKKKIYPTLWALFKEKLLPTDTQIVGYARSKLKVDDIRQKCQPWFKVKSGEEQLAEDFWKVNNYVAGGYDAKRDFEMLNQEMTNLEAKVSKTANRVFYLALPPSVFASVTSQLKATCMSTSGWTRCIVETFWQR